MNKKVIITGPSGMIGRLVLELCLKSEVISEIINLVRKESSMSHPKLKELVVSDFLNLDNIKEEFADIACAFYCIGVYTGAVPRDEFKKITVDLPVAFAKALYEKSPDTTFCLLSGQGADRSEKSRAPFARYKGMVENQLSAMGFGAFRTLRPGYIYPVQKRKEPNLMYSISRLLYPLLKRLGKNMSVTSEELALGMFQVGIKGYHQEILENRDIVELVRN